MTASDSVATGQSLLCLRIEQRFVLFLKRALVLLLSIVIVSMFAAYFRLADFFSPKADAKLRTIFESTKFFYLIFSKNFSFSTFALLCFSKASAKLAPFIETSKYFEKKFML
jgi:hypothetical protein